MPFLAIMQFHCQNPACLYLSLCHVLCHQTEGTLAPLAFHAQSRIIALRFTLQNFMRTAQEDNFQPWRQNAWKDRRRLGLVKGSGERCTQAAQPLASSQSGQLRHGDVTAAFCYFTAIRALPLYLSRVATHSAAVSSPIISNFPVLKEQQSAGNCKI